ncbi:MAG: hypothetical protein KUG79_11725 [Pseudomonadales bacterium]|nr:hypothetical protein [Pseudomonadales bacterium]
MLKKIFTLGLIGLLLAIFALPFMLVQQESLVRGSVRYDANKTEQAKALLRRNDPRRLQPGEFATKWIDEQELVLIVSYILAQLDDDAAIAIEIHPGRAYIQLTIRLPENPIGPYLNFTLLLNQSSSILSIDSLTLGHLTIPGWIAEFVKQSSHQALLEIPEYSASITSLNGLQLLEDRMLVRFQWQPELLGRIKSKGQAFFVDEDLKIRLLAYAKQINQIANDPSLANKVSLKEFLGPLFYLAQLRGGDPVEENRAALLALSFYFSGIDVARMLGVELPDKTSTKKRLTLSNRYDFAQHFLTSAALTLLVGEGLADKIGLFKELDDAMGGSGFSFTDLGADRAGVRLAEFAISDTTSALQLQTFMTTDFSEASFMPNFLDLPELLTHQNFEENFGGVNGQEYNKLLRKIETRIDQCPLYQ